MAHSGRLPVFVVVRCDLTVHLGEERLAEGVFLRGSVAQAVFGNMLHENCLECEVH